VTLKNTNSNHRKSQVGRPPWTLPDEVSLNTDFPENPNRYQRRKMKKMIKKGMIVPLKKMPF